MELATRQLIVVRASPCQFLVMPVKLFKSSEPIMEDSPLLFVTNMATPSGALIVCRIPQLAFFKEGNDIIFVLHYESYTIKILETENVTETKNKNFNCSGKSNVWKLEDHFKTDSFYETVEVLDC